MRAIEFKGRKKGSTEWFEGNLHTIEGDCYIYPKNAQNSPDYYEVEESTVSQFTGLLDKNGVKIWEGDILQGFCDYPASYEVYFENGSFKLRYLMREGTYYDWGLLSRIFEINGMYAEVISNIHDNPELLTPQVSKEGGEPCTT